MKNNLFILSGMVFSLLFLLPLISSANTITLTLPAENDSISGNYVLSADLDTNDANITSATFFYNDGTSNVTIGTTANDTETQFNYTWATTSLVDVNDWNIWVNCTNETGILISEDSSTGVDIDNGNPTATLSSSTFSDETSLVSSTSFTIGLDADSTIGISSCKVYFIDESGTITTKSVSASANACSTSTTASAESLSINEQYSVYMEATDGNGDSTNATARTLIVTPSSGGGGSSAVKQSIIGDDSVSETKTNPITIFINTIINFFKNLF
jgi:hypothetical protein